MKIDEFIKRSNIIHNNKYDYSLVKYKNNSTKVDIICPKHGKFEQRPKNHLDGQGCPSCGNEIKLFKILYTDNIYEKLQYLLNKINFNI